MASHGAASSFCYALLLLFLIVMGRRVGAQEEQLSRPVAHDDNMKDLAQNNKFLQQEASDDSIAFPTLYVSSSFEEEEEEESHHPCFPLLCKIMFFSHACNHHALGKINQGSSSL
jgi:hypothetical protein